MEVEAGIGGAGRSLSDGLCGRESDAAAVICSKNFNKNLIEPVDQGWGGAKVGCERDEVEEERVRMGGVGVRDLKADRLHALEEFGVGVAEEVDGLHGVAVSLDRKSTRLNSSHLGIS